MKRLLAADESHGAAFIFSGCFSFNETTFIKSEHIYIYTCSKYIILDSSENLNVISETIY